jgi:hypothetical protein
MREMRAKRTSAGPTERLWLGCCAGTHSRERRIRERWIARQSGEDHDRDSTSPTAARWPASAAGHNRSSETFLTHQKPFSFSG